MIATGNKLPTMSFSQNWNGEVFSSYVLEYLLMFELFVRLSIYKFVQFRRKVLNDLLSSENELPNKFFIESLCLR